MEQLNLLQKQIQRMEYPDLTQKQRWQVKQSEVPEINKNDEFLLMKVLNMPKIQNLKMSLIMLSSNVAGQPVKSTVETVGNVGTVNSYKKPENSSRHGKVWRRGLCLRIESV